MTPINRVLAKLPDARKTSRGWQAKCPAHDDGVASLSITEAGDGKVLVRCFAGCDFRAIGEALGLEAGEFFASNGQRPHGRGGRRPHARRTKQQGGDPHGPPGNSSDSRTAGPSGLTVEAYATAKRLVVSELYELGLSNVTIQWPRVRIPYFDESGLELAVRFRDALNGNGFRWKAGTKVAPYGLWRLRDARAARLITLVEGESDAQTCWHHGVPALGIPGASTWRPEWATYLDGIDVIYLVVEPDRGGRTLVELVGRSPLRDRVRLVSLAPHKDPSALHLADPNRDAFTTAWETALARSQPLRDVAAAEQAAAASAALAEAGPLLDDPRLLDRVREVIKARGYVGDCTPPMVVFFALCSRVLDRPINAVLVGPSASGKNAAVNAATSLCPATVFVAMSASSPRALIYSSESFEHRTLVVAEADSLPDDGPAASAIRSIAEDNAMSYETVERNPATNQYETRRIVKPGPTGLVTTSTRSLRVQLGTRHLEIHVSDDAEQTRLVMLAHARTVDGTREAGPDLRPFLALQTWLEKTAERRVVVPFSGALAQIVPNTTVRMRRDFRQLLTAVQVAALLRQGHRTRSEDGAVIATLDDYAEARNLLAAVFDAVEANGLTPAIRATVEAVKPGEELTLGQLAERLGMSTSGAGYRVAKAVKGGWLVNNEARKNQPARFACGAPLPDAVVHALPTVEALRIASECPNESEGDIAPPSPPVEREVGEDDVDPDDEGEV